MEKRLVKTAKQQFEERLRELTLIKEFQLTASDIYYLCENEHREMSILRKIHNEEFYEYKYGKSYQDLIDSEEFLNEMTGRYIERRFPIKPLFEWYASADKDNEPFTLDDIWMCDLELTDHIVLFKDLYEELLTAKEQWVRDSKDAKTTMVKDKDSYRIVLREECIDVYVDRDGKEFFKETIPSIEELRKDAEFVTKYLSYMNANRSNFMKHALDWLSSGKFTMNEYGLLDIYKVFEGHCNKTYRYVDEEAPKPIVKQSFKEDLDTLRKKMIDHIIQLCEQGMKLNVEVFCQNYSMGWEDGHYQCLNDITDFYLMKNPDTEEWNYYMKENNTSYNGVLSILNIETLYYIIEALQ